LPENVASRAMTAIQEPPASAVDALGWDVGD
jgi:hypothetical protein